MSKELALARRCGDASSLSLSFLLVGFCFFSFFVSRSRVYADLNNCIFPNTQHTFYIIRVFREFLWLSKRCSRSVSEHRAKTEEVKRTIRTSLFAAAARKNEKKKKNDDEFIAAERALEDEIVKFLLGKVGFLKMNASGSVSRELRSREERKSGGRKDTVLLSTTFVLRGGELVPTSEEGVDVESKGSRVNDGKLSNEEAWTYHNRLMKRQYYGKTPPKMPEPF